jgi:hypothetical protein
MEWFKVILSVILAAIVILIILTVIEIGRCRTREAVRMEGLDVAACALSGDVKLPYDPRSRYDMLASVDSPNFGDISRDTVSQQMSEIDRDKYLATKCDETPGCIAFTTSGYLKSGVRAQEARVPCSNCGLFVRKCAVPEQFFAELYDDYFFGGNKFLVPVGLYPHMAEIVWNGKSPANDSIRSAKVPAGIWLTLFQNASYGGEQLKLGKGEYPDLTRQSFAKSASSVTVTHNRQS